MYNVSRNMFATANVRELLVTNMRCYGNITRGLWCYHNVAHVTQYQQLVCMVPSPDLPYNYNDTIIIM